MRYKVICAYDGSNFSGFQSQINARAIQDEIEQTLSKYFNTSIKIIFASRTDAKVHAYGQVFHFDLDKDIDTIKCRKNLNRLLPEDISFEDITSVNDDFHCRYNIKQKHYQYIISFNEKDIFKRNYVYHCPYKLDEEVLKKALFKFLGTHNFESFNSTPLSIVKDQTKTIDDILIKRNGDYLIIDFYGKSFLRYMIRVMVGISVEVARGKKQLKDIDEMLERPSKTYQRYCISAKGLYLMSIEYEI